ncbi:MAG: right-handed parallel beta-helix repeat-containing protein [Petrotogales bacterium]
MKKILTISIMFLFIGMTIPSTGLVVEKPSYSLDNRGDTLYVGGSGPNNYTKIQDAIDDASDGDTVFVYDDSSPYYERLNVDKSINLIGEDRDTTAIESKGNVVEVSADWVNISDFTIRNASDSGILVYSNYSTISGNNIHSNSHDGIYLKYSNSNVITGNNISNGVFDGIHLYHSNNNTIFGNNINLNNNCGLGLYDSNNNVISDNNISNNNFGLGLHSSNNIIKDNIITSNNMIGLIVEGNSNTISSNNISNNEFGIYLDSSNHNNITKNNIKNNEIFGLLLSSANNNIIELNNFIGNKIQAFFVFSWRNNWDGNYWNNWIGLKLPIPFKVIFGFIGINFDWNPAREPYDIGV